MSFRRKDLIRLATAFDAILYSQFNSATLVPFGTSLTIPRLCDIESFPVSNSQGKPSYPGVSSKAMLFNASRHKSFVFVGVGRKHLFSC